MKITERNPYTTEQARQAFLEEFLMPIQVS